MSLMALSTAEKFNGSRHIVVIEPPTLGIFSAFFKFSVENLNSFICLSCTRFKLIYLPRQKLYLMNLEPLGHRPACGHVLNNPLLEDEKSQVL